MGGIVWVIVVGVIAGIIARMLSPGPNNPAGFILTTLLGIAGAFLATWIGQAMGYYSPNQGAGFITATVGQSLFFPQPIIGEGKSRCREVGAHLASDTMKAQMALAGVLLGWLKPGAAQRGTPVETFPWNGLSGHPSRSGVRMRL
jgi:uncharacterized membrane protein YeaQ/YmgE (transglycosylase-associated protein family)